MDALSSISLGHCVSVTDSIRGQQIEGGRFGEADLRVDRETKVALFFFKAIDSEACRRLEVNSICTDDCYVKLADTLPAVPLGMVAEVDFKTPGRWSVELCIRLGGGMVDRARRRLRWHR